MNTSDIIVEPHGGLANRVRVIFAAKLFCKLNKKSLYVNWIHSHPFPLRRRAEITRNHFLEFFEPLNGVNFLNREQSIQLLNDSIEPTYKGTDVGFFRDKTPDFSKHFPLLYKELKPTASIKKEINNFALTLGEFNAMHIRRTDHSNFLRRINIEPDKIPKFEKFTEKSDKNIFLATDDRDIQIHFRNKYGNKVHYFKEIDPTKTFNKGERTTELKDAIIDMYLCALADSFMGTKLSSFSSLICHLRNQ